MCYSLIIQFENLLEENAKLNQKLDAHLKAAEETNDQKVADQMEEYLTNFQAEIEEKAEEADTSTSTTSSEKKILVYHRRKHFYYFNKIYKDVTSRNVLLV